MVFSGSLMNSYECRNAVGYAQEVIPEGGLGFLLYSCFINSMTFSEKAFSYGNVLALSGMRS